MVRLRNLERFWEKFKTSWIDNVLIYFMLKVMYRDNYFLERSLIHKVT
jgi:hypothetical protein